MWTRIHQLYRQRRLQKQNAINVTDLIKPQLGRTQSELENIMRWEDDGGLIINEVAKLTIKIGSESIGRPRWINISRS